MKVFGANVPTHFPNPSNVTEIRFYGMCHMVLTIGALMIVFPSDRKHGDPVDFSAGSLIIRFCHIACITLTLTLGPNSNPIGWVSRFCSVYGICV